METSCVAWEQKSFQVGSRARKTRETGNVHSRFDLIQRFSTSKGRRPSMLKKSFAGDGR
jgi:hypothetical protein